MTCPIVALAASLFAAPAAAGDTASLTVEVRGLASARGLLQVGLYRQADFPAPGREVMGIAEPAASGAVVVRFDGVAAGAYAVAVYHDVDGDHALDRNLFGVPQEDYAFSNNARGLFGPPDFAEASFELSGDASIAIDLRR